LDQPVPSDTKIGHVHLYVANLYETLRFYHDLLGFDNMGMARISHGDGFRWWLPSSHWL
jgi:catechol-2,3-dioxygenase